VNVVAEDTVLLLANIVVNVSIIKLLQKITDMTINLSTLNNLLDFDR